MSEKDLEKVGKMLDQEQEGADNQQENPLNEENGYEKGENDEEGTVT